MWGLAIAATDAAITTEDSIVLRESIRARVSVAPIGTLGTFLPVAIFIPFLLSESVHWIRIVLWVSPAVLSVFARLLYSRSVLKDIDSRATAQLKRADRILRWNSVVNQTVVGMGIWLIQVPGSDSLLLALFVTLIVIMFAFGTMVNLFSDFATYAISAPLLVGQPALYWMMQDDFGWAIAIGMISGLLLSYSLVKRGSQIFRQSVLMRFEKNQLLAEVESQKSQAEAALEEARAANEARAFFMAAASRDIKQPLFALGMLTDTLLMSSQDEKTKTILERQRRSIDRMMALFDDLMDLARFEQGGYEVNLMPVPATELSIALDDELSTLCREKNLAWEMDIQPATLDTDPELAIRLIRNLLHNAARYTDTGKIACKGYAKGKSYILAVTDTGPGIAPEDQEKMFDRFRRLEGTDDNTGAGLGLTIVRHIVDTLAIDLSLDSEVERGTTFRVEFPAYSGDESELTRL
ncbi:MAG: HAMP domain-containing sensor histidine kinase [Gammaproteobacteria bacterium]|nr:HAMP domain-containing sensor histidine kinase [Gammaproteobacteria bacterium]